MLLYLILLFTIVPLAELAILIKAGTYLGATNTILIVILTGIVGATLAKIQGLSALRRIQEDLETAILPADKLFDGLLILIAAALLITPGLITDFLGFLLLIPPTRAIIKRYLRAKAKKLIEEGEVHIGFFHRF